MTAFSVAMSSILAQREAGSGTSPRTTGPLATIVLRIAALAIAYYLMGRLGLLMAVPPGYATIIWPPSGISLAVLILYGARLWPGVLLGSLMVNLDVSGAFATGADATKIYIALGIALGSTLQTVCAHALVCRVLGSPVVLKNWRSAIMLLVLAGPLGCLIAPTMGVATMYYFGVLRDAQLAANWLIWWKGDTFGVLVFLPLLLAASSGTHALIWRDRRLSTLPPAAVLALLVPLGLTFYAWNVMVHYRYEKNFAQFKALAQGGKEALLRRVASYEDALLGGVGFFMGSEYVSRSEWRQYVTAIDIGQSYPGMYGIGWIDALVPAQLDEYTARMRAEGAPGFHIHPQAAVTPAYYVISYIEPQDVNEAAMGLNIAFESNRYTAAMRARDTGLATLTRRIELVQDASHGVGFLFLLPVYESGRPIDSVAQRREALRGWIGAPLTANSLLQGLSSGADRPLNMSVYDGVEQQMQLIYSNRPRGPNPTPMFTLSETVTVGGQRWVLVWESTPAFEALAANYEHMLVMAGGLLLTALFGGFLMMIARRAQTVQELVRQRTQQLQRSEEALRSSEATFRSAMEHASIGMALVAPDGRFIRVNQALCDLLGYAAFELEGREFQSITHPDDIDADQERMHEALNGSIRSYQIEKRYFRNDGHVIWALLDASLLRKSDGTPQHFVAQIQDITQRRQMDRMKREFVSTVSHELRTPLTSIRGSLGLIASGVLGQLPQKIESMIRIAHTNSERLVRIINDILDIEKIESGRLDLHLTNIPLASFLKQAVEANEAYGAKFNVLFDLQPVAQDIKIKADHDRLMQVMANLLSNAAKFSPQGGAVVVRASAVETRARVEVEDYGTGIPDEFHSRIFEKFAQADSSSSRRFEGTGLGLSITRQLVEAMGGTIGFITATGMGTRFHFELPRAIAEQSSSLSETAVMRILVCGDDSVITGRQQQLHRVLHVEDDVDLSTVLAEALSAKAQVVAAPTLHEAQQKLSQEQYSLVVLDLELPDGNGLALLDTIEKQCGDAVPVVILSASEVPRDIQQRVAATLIKSRMSEARITETIMEVVRQKYARPVEGSGRTAAENA